MKVINFGSLNLDNLYRVDKFVSPGETKACTDYRVVAGGKGLNQSIAMALAGMNVYHAGCIGNNSEMLADLLQSKGVNTKHLQKLDAEAGHTIIQIDDMGQNCILLYKGTNGMLTEEYIDAVLEDFGGDDILVLQNETNLVPYIMKAAHKKGMRIAFNASPINDQICSYPLELVTWLFVNEIEGEFLSGKADYNEISLELAKTYPNTCIILTLGSEGSTSVIGGESFWQPAFNVEAVDTTAAGDTFTGYFLSGITKDLPMQEVLRISSAASALAITHIGAAQSIPSRDRVDEFLRNNINK